MSSFTLQKSFEKSLRSSSGSYQVPITTPLKTEIHKGCTGKAHACGSIKSTNTVLANKPSPVPKVKCDGKTLRKNSLSSETVSDSGSEISSWNSNKDSPTPNATAAPTNQLKPLKRTKSVNYGSSNGSLIASRRRTSDSADVPDNVRSSFRRGRLLSDGGDDKKLEATDDVSRLRRTSSFRLKNVPPMIPVKPKIAQPPPTPIKRNGSFNNRLRNSFRNKNTATAWSTLWESSFSCRNGGGNFRVLDKKFLEQLEKVNKPFCVSKRLFD